MNCIVEPGFTESGYVTTRVRISHRVLADVAATVAGASLLLENGDDVDATGHEAHAA